MNTYNNRQNSASRQRRFRGASSTAARATGWTLVSNFILIAIIYAAGAALGLFVFRALSGRSWNFIPAMAGADFAATVWIYIWSTALGNASVYDPYWSAAPLLMLGLAAHGAVESGIRLSPEALLTLVLVFVWGFRLTANWALNFGGLGSQDWRYDKYRAQYPRIWPLISFFGIHLFPTVIVFQCCIPAFCALFWTAAPADSAQMPAQAQAAVPLSRTILIIIGAAVSLSGTALELVADAQMRRFRLSAAAPGSVNESGLWKYSRHPNYLGEIMMWWGIYFFGAGVCSGPGAFIYCLPGPHTGSAVPGACSDVFPEWAFAGALVNTLLFVFISVPLLEKRQLARRPDYEDYIKRTGALLPYFGHPKF